jgi:DNA-binding XRE family transcriptional regulator
MGPTSLLRNPSLRSLIKIANAFRVTIAELFSSD